MPGRPKRPASYRMVSPPTWELARADYLGGMTAQQVADKYVIGVHNLRAHISENGWSKRALAAARTAPGPGGPPLPAPLLAPDAGPDRSGDDLLEAVLERARAALKGGRGGEASALLRAVREYVIVRQDIDDARAAVAPGAEGWDRAQPARAGELTEIALIQSLHVRWARLTVEEEAERADPDGSAGLRAWVEANAGGQTGGLRKRRR